jgi:hypothetical protein
MSAGDFSKSVYESNVGNFYKIRIQPETLTLTFNSQANVAGSGTPGSQTPSAKVSGSRNSVGVNARLVRVKFTTTVPPGYSGGKDTISLPVLTPSTYNTWVDDAIGTYTLGGTSYDVQLIGRTPEKIK